MNIALQNLITPIISQVSAWINIFWVNFEAQNLSTWQVIIDILLIAVIFYWLLLLLRGTRSSAVMAGIIILIFVYALAQSFGLVGSSWLFENVATLMIIALPIVFQPEIRSGLERLGRGGKLKSNSPLETKNKIEVILETCRYLTKNKLGGTIVVERDTPLREYAETGILLGASATSQLLIAIFQKKSPLHDGAVILKHGKIISASSVLPLSVITSEKAWGTRHKSALGLSEVSDAIVVVASEERHVLTLFMNGEHTERISENKLREVLEKELLPHKYRLKKSKK